MKKKKKKCAARKKGERRKSGNLQKKRLRGVEKCRTVFADKTEILPYNGYKHKRTLTDGACER